MKLKDWSHYAKIWSYSDGDKTKYRWLCGIDNAGRDSFDSFWEAKSDLEACGYWTDSEDC